MAPACVSSQGSLAVRLHVWYCPPSPRLWQANSNPYTSTSHQAPQIDVAHWCAVRQIRQLCSPPSPYKDRWVQSMKSIKSMTVTHIYIYTLRFKSFAIFSESAIFLPVSTFFSCAVSALALLICYEQMGASRVQQWPELKSVTAPSHPAIFHLTLHFSMSSLFSSLTSPTISLLQRMTHSRIIQHNENAAATQNLSLCAPWGMTTTAWDGDGGTGGSPSAWDEKKGWDLSSTDGIIRKVLCFYQKKPCAIFLDTEWWLIFFFTIHIIFTHKVWKLAVRWKSCYKKGPGTDRERE